MFCVNSYTKFYESTRHTISSGDIEKAFGDDRSGLVEVEGEFFGKI